MRGGPGGPRGSPHLLGEGVSGRGADVGHEGAAADVLVVAEDVDGVGARLLRPVPHVAGAVSPVVALDLGLRGALHRETWGGGGELGGQGHPETTLGIPEEKLPQGCRAPRRPSAPRHRWGMQTPMRGYRDPLETPKPPQNRQQCPRGRSEIHAPLRDPPPRLRGGREITKSPRTPQNPWRTPSSPSTIALRFLPHPEGPNPPQAPLGAS